MASFRTAVTFASLLLPGVSPLAASAPAAADLDATRQHAAKISPLIAAAVSPQRVWPPPAGAAASRPNATLAAYAAAPATDPAKFESFAEAARRILAGSTTTKLKPEDTSRRLDEAAEAILTGLPAAEADPAARDELKLAALVARFHARRMMAAIRYNLFLRGLSLAELLAATNTERDAVGIWREIVALTRDPALQAQAREELRHLESNLKDLEEQCCPPDETTLKTKIWMPAPARPAENN